MTCGSTHQRIMAALDQRFESEGDGSAAIHWLDESTWEALGSCRALLNYLTILGLEGTSPSVTIVARGSTDCRTWSTIAGLTSPAFSAAGATPNRVMLVPQLVTPLPPYLQLGLSITGSGVQAAARVTWSIEPRGCSGTPAVTLSGSQSNPSAGFDLTSAIDLLGELDVSFAAAITTATATVVDLETSPDSSTWFVAASISLSGTDESSAARVTNLQRYARLVVRSAVTTEVAWSFKALVP